MWTTKHGSLYPFGLWAISRLGVDRVMISADFPCNAWRLSRAGRDA
jgi:hypothetical protein